MVDENAADIVAQRHKALFQQILNQRFPRRKIVIQHRRRHPGLFGNGIERHAGRAVTSKQRQGDIYQLLAVSGSRFFTAWPTGAARRFISFLCWHMLAIS